MNSQTEFKQDYIFDISFKENSLAKQIAKKNFWGRGVEPEREKEYLYLFYIDFLFYIDIHICLLICFFRILYLFKTLDFWHVLKEEGG